MSLEFLCMLRNAHDRFSCVSSKSSNSYVTYYQSLSFHRYSGPDANSESMQGKKNNLWTSLQNAAESKLPVCFRNSGRCPSLASRRYSAIVGPSHLFHGTAHCWKSDSSVRYRYMIMRNNYSTLPKPLHWKPKKFPSISFSS